MSAIVELVGFGLQQLAESSKEQLAEGGINAVVRLIDRYLVDHSHALPRAIAKANDSAWLVLSMALKGDGLLQRGLDFVTTSADLRGLRDQIRTFLDSPVAGFPDLSDTDRRNCLTEWQEAKKNGLLSADKLSPAQMHQAAAGFQRYTDPQGLIAGAHRAVAGVAARLQTKCPKLAKLLCRPTPDKGPPLLAIAFTFFLRRETAVNQELNNELSFDLLQRLYGAQETTFAKLSVALVTLGSQLESVLTSVERIETSQERIEAGQFDVQATLDRYAQQAAERHEEVMSLLREVLRLQEKANMQRGEVKPQHSLSINGEENRRAVKQIEERYRRLSSEEQNRTPELLNGIGKLQMGIGEYPEAKKSFARVTHLVHDTRAKAEAHHNAYRAALEQKQWPEALQELLQAARLDPQRFEPFPLARFEPKNILGAGGFGTAILCHDRIRKEDLVIKTFHSADLERSLTNVFTEGRILEKLRHEAIIGVHDYDFADPHNRRRPYLVMDFFPGGTLEDFLQQRGPLSMADFLTVARQVAEGMKAAHQANVWHRDLKPGNILVRKEGKNWRIKIIDFGLALRRSVVETSMAVKSLGDTLLADSVAGTLEYAPPEQMGKLPGVKPGPYSDVYSFGKTGCFALFHTTQPLSRHWKTLPEPLRDLLERCIDGDLQHRCQSFDEVVDGLDKIRRAEDELEQKQKEAERQRQEEERRQLLRQLEEGKDELRQLLLDIYRRTTGHPTREEIAAAKELVKQHGLPNDQARQVITEAKQQWQAEQKQEEAKIAERIRADVWQEAQQQREFARQQEQARLRLEQERQQREQERQQREQERQQRDQEQVARQKNSALAAEAILKASGFAALGLICLTLGILWIIWISDGKDVTPSTRWVNIPGLDGLLMLFELLLLKLLKLLGFVGAPFLILMGLIYLGNSIYEILRIRR